MRRPRRKSARTDKSQAPDGSCTVSIVWFEDGALGFRFSDGPWQIETAFIGAANGEEMTLVRRPAPSSA